jgi:hypothetical protein
MSTKNKCFFLIFYYYLPSLGLFTSLSKETAEIKVFLHFFLLMEGSMQLPLTTDLDLGGPKYLDPTDSDPEHWYPRQDNRDKNVNKHVR